MYKSSKSPFGSVISSIASILLGVGLSVQIADTVYAQTFFPTPKTFTVTKSCNATTSLSGGSPVALTVNKGYVALGENKIPDGTHSRITVQGVGDRWVALSCGTYGTVNGGGNTGGGATLPSGTVAFFDNINNPVSGLKFGSPADVTPVAPPLNAFDTAVVNLCGAPGKVVSTNEFRSMMNANPTVLENIKAAVSPTSSTPDFLTELTNMWFNIKGFDHVMCGEPVAGGSIGGLHFFGRYVELQNKGLAGRLTNNLNNEEVLSGSVYTMGVKMKVGDSTSQSTIKGYGYTLNAEEILRVGSYAFKKNPTTSSTSTACILPVTDDGKSFKMVFVRRNNGIRTFFPDATPSTTDPACKN
jgi:hypothetical protein